jgi:hypothetical protein
MLRVDITLAAHKMAGYKVGGIWTKESPNYLIHAQIFLLNQ